MEGEGEDAHVNIVHIEGKWGTRPLYRCPAPKRYYYFEETALNFDDAATKCEAKGMELATINNPYEN